MLAELIDSEPCPGADGGRAAGGGVLPVDRRETRHHSTRQNAEILDRVNRNGRVYLSNATVRGSFVLRACITNHRTTDADVAAVVDEVLAAAPERGCPEDLQELRVKQGHTFALTLAG